jgi:hypothetical protein
VGWDPAVQAQHTGECAQPLQARTLGAWMAFDGEPAPALKNAAHFILLTAALPDPQSHDLVRFAATTVTPSRRVGYCFWTVSAMRPGVQTSTSVLHQGNPGSNGRLTGRKSVGRNAEGLRAVAGPGAVRLGAAPCGHAASRAQSKQPKPHPVAWAVAVIFAVWGRIRGRGRRPAPRRRTGRGLCRP